MAAVTDKGGTRYDLELQLQNEFGDNYSIDDSSNSKWIISADNESVEVPPLVEIETCSIVFNSNGGTGTMDTQTIPCNLDIALIENKFVKDNYAFDGWNTKEDGSGDSYEDKQNIDINHDITLYAQWREVVITELKTGQTINNKMKSLASSLTNIIYIKRSDTIEENKKIAANNIAIDNEVPPVYMWYENGTIWYYTEADEIYLNSNSAKLFNELKSVKTIDLSFKTDNVQTMKQMFYNCNALESLDVSGFKTDNCEDMSSAFGNCTTLTKLDLGNFNTENVTITDNMFNGSINIIELNVSNFYTPKLTSMMRMFSSLKSVRILDIGKMDTSIVTNMEKSFDNMDELTTIYVGSGFITNNASKSNNMFNNDLKLVGGNGTKYDKSKLNKIYAKIDSEEDKGYFTDISKKTK